MGRIVAFGTDHSAYREHNELLNYIRGADPSVTILHFGPFTAESCDYPDIARQVAEAVASGTCDVGILICGTGIGMSLAANRVPGIRAALCHDVTTTRLARTHNNANILCAGIRTCGLLALEEMFEVFLSVNYSAEPRHQKRIDKMLAMEHMYACGNPQYEALHAQTPVVVHARL